MNRVTRTILVTVLMLAVLGLPFGCMATSAESSMAQMEIPKIDCSTARIPITDAIYELLTGTYQAEGSAPMCSKTHGAWLNLADGTADILFLVAPTADEFAYFAEKGVDIEMKIYGFDGLVFLGNESNPVDNLTSKQIRDIYSGKIKNWEQLPGGKNADMLVYIRNAESGSQRLFESLVWAGYDMPDFQSMQFREGEVDPVVSQRTEEITTYYEMDSITRNVLVNQYSIGFNIMSYIDSEFLHSAGENVTQYVMTTGQVNLRTGPGLDYDKLGSIKTGTQLTYLDETSIDDRGVAWYRVQQGTQEASWISSRYSSLEGNVSENLKLFAVDGYAPTTEKFAAGNYPFLTTSYVVIRADEPADSPARKLFDWVGSEESRALIAENSTLTVAFSDSVVLRTQQREPLENAELVNAVARLDKEILAREELYLFTEEELKYLRNGISALSGKIFFAEKYNRFFQAMDWYQGESQVDAEIAVRFNEVQKQNMALIIGYERELRRANANRAENIRTIAYSKGEANMLGDDVLEVQRALAAQGYLSEAECDGDFGQKSANAVRAFQAERQLEETGEVNADTRMLLLD